MLLSNWVAGAAAAAPSAWTGVLPRACQVSLDVRWATPLEVVSARVERIDETHANAHAAWQRMGRPRAATPDQAAALLNASALVELPLTVHQVDETQGMLQLDLPAFGVAAVRLRLQVPSTLRPHDSSMNDH